LSPVMQQLAVISCIQRPTSVRRSRVNLTGRDHELGVIAEVVSAAAIRGSAILFVGEAGVGKTALLDLAGDMAADTGQLVVRVTGAEFEADIGYSALMQAVLPLAPFADRQ